MTPFGDAYSPPGESLTREQILAHIFSLVLNAKVKYANIIITHVPMITHKCFLYHHKIKSA